MTNNSDSSSLAKRLEFELFNPSNLSKYVPGGIEHGEHIRYRPIVKIRLEWLRLGSAALTQSLALRNQPLGLLC
jgi:hypothetical protein